MTVLYFILGGIYTIICISAGIYLGYTFKWVKIQKPEIIDKVTNRLKKPFGSAQGKEDAAGSGQAGPVKPITKIEREAEGQKGFTDRVKELTTD